MAFNWKHMLTAATGAIALTGCSVVDGAEMLIEDESGGSSEGWSSSWSGEPFDRITLAGPDNIVFTTEGEHAVSASGDEKALEKLQYRVRDGELRIRRKKSNFSFGDSGEATIKVSAPALRALALAGSGSARVDRMEGDEIELSIAGSGDADVAQLKARKLDGAIAGSGSLKLAGSADSADISIAGSGSVLGERFSSQAVDISIAGSGDVTMASDGNVDASLMGSGDVTIKGKAKCKSSSMGSGSITCG
jgi:hypothetical protein